MLLPNVTAIAIGDRALLIEGAPGSGKSTLALLLIDRGAVLIGDDGVALRRDGNRLYASPPPRTAGLLEVRNLGLLSFPSASDVPVSLVVRIDSKAERFIEAADQTEIDGVTLPLLRLWPGGAELAIKAELALERFG